MKRLISTLLLFVIFSLQSLLAQTEFGKNTGEYGEFFAALTNMIRDKNPNELEVTLRGKKYKLLVSWVRDHVHVMKAMKYFIKDASSGVQLFIDQQTAQGFFYDYIYPLESDIINRLNFFQPRFTKVFPADKWQMHRVPVEADVEYLVVEGVYAAWQSTGDTAMLRKWIPALDRALLYVKSDSIRWSKKYQLVKRGYTIDTWDFQFLPYSRQEYSRRYGDPSQGIMDVKDTTFMGVMHGDNSGMYAACRQLANMYAAIGNKGMSTVWNKEAELYQARANTLLWNGKYYKHFLPDGPLPPYIKFDIENQLSLSNPYDINRGLPYEDMAESIIQTYLDLKEKTKDSSFAEWFSLYPSVSPDWSGHAAGTYVNGGVLMVTAGELAKAAFQHGYEAYGADILRRLNEVTKKSNGFLSACYKPDGTVDEGLPDAWAQAAIFSAMVEGLAGVVDKSSLFEKVEISPRWLATGKEEASVSIAYGPSGRKVRYDYRQNKSKKSFTLNITGDAKEYTIRMLLPDGIKKAKATVNGKAAGLYYETIRNSVYAVVTGITASQPVVVIKY
jgi:hypothetical protein